MKKIFYECLYSELNKLYKEVDAATTKLCGLKRKLTDMSEILENEYKNKYKKALKKVFSQIATRYAPKINFYTSKFYPQNFQYFSEKCRIYAVFCWFQFALFAFYQEFCLLLS